MLFTLEDSLHTTNLTIGKTYFNSVRVVGGICKEVLDDPDGFSSSSLILFQYDCHAKS